MECSQAYQALEMLKSREMPDISPDSVSYLQKKGLVSLITYHEYSSMQAEILRLPELEKDSEELTRSLEQQRTKLVRVYKKQLSRWHRIRSTVFHIGTSGLKQEAERCNELEDEFHSRVEKADAAITEIKRLESIQADLEMYVNMNEVYVKTTESWEKMAQQLSARLPRLTGVSYDKFEQEFEQANRAVRSAYERFRQFYRFLLEKEFEEGPIVVEYALSLSGLEGNIEEIYREAEEIDKFLIKKMDCQISDYDRLRTISALIKTPRERGGLLKELKRLYSIALKNDQEDNYSTLFETSLSLRIPLPTPEDKWARYDRMGDALDKRAWNKGTTATCYIAANLSRRNGDEAEIAEDFRNLEKKIVERGRCDCVESGIAAMILMDMKGALDEKADRFNETFETMNRHGWSLSESFYEAAAAISLMPGTVEENVQLVHDLKEMMDEDEFEYELTDNAVKILAGCCRKPAAAGWQNDPPPFQRKRRMNMYGLG